MTLSPFFHFNVFPFHRLFHFTLYPRLVMVINILKSNNKKMSCTLVSGFIDIAAYDPASKNRRPVEFYLNHGKKLLRLPVPKVIFLESSHLATFQEFAGDKTILVPFEKEQLSLWSRRSEILTLALPKNRNKDKDTHDYMIVQHQKVHWCVAAAAFNPFSSSHFAWVDFGTHHTLTDGETPSNLISSALERVTKFLKGDKILIPGCIPLPRLSSDTQKNFPPTEMKWHFCGSFFSGTSLALRKFSVMQDEAVVGLIQRKTFTWEVMTWVHCFYQQPNLFEWYMANHGNQMYMTLLPDDFKAYYELAKKERISSHNKQAYAYCQKALEMKPTPDLIQDFTRDDIDLLNELAICSWYVKDMELGLKSVDQLLLSKQVSAETKKLMRNNAIFYITSLESHLATGSCTYKDIGLDLHIENKQHVTNPSIVACEHVESGHGTLQYLVSVRTVNYARDEKTHRFHFLGDATRFESHTYLYVMRTDGTFSRPMEVTGDRLQTPTCPAQGIEDARLFICQNNGYDVWMACTFPDTNEYNKTRTGLICLGGTTEVSNAIENNETTWNAATLKAYKCFTLRGPVENRHEKNWIPFVHMYDEIFSIYSFDPLVILKPNLRVADVAMNQGMSHEQEKTSVTIMDRKLPLDMSHFRGSSCSIPWDGQQLFIVHEVDESYRYTHRFVLFDGYRITLISLPFYFEKQGVEYCAGMTKGHYDFNVYITYGVGDYKARMCVVKIDAIRKFLEKGHSLEE